MMLYIRMLLTMAVSLYTSRVVLNVLGVEDYGTYNVVGGVVTMFGFFNSAMASATQRFLSFDLGRGDHKQLRKTFNATQFIHIWVALIVLLLAETFGLWFLNNYMNIPEGRMEAAQWVFHFAVFSFILSVMQVPYNALIIARERMSVYAYVSILDVILKLLIVFMLTWISFDKLKLYAVLQFSVAFVIIAIYRVYVLRKFDESRFEVVKDKAMYKTLVSYSGWNLFGGLAGIAKGQGVNIVLNIFFGTVVNAAQGIASQINGAINAFVTNFQMASNPQIIKSYAADDKEYMTNLVIRTSKFSFYLLFLLTLPVILEIDYILKIWLKIVPEYTALFTVLVLINALIETISGPLKTTVHAIGRIKVYQAVVGSLLILVLPISYVLLHLGCPPEVVFFVSIFIDIVALIFRFYFLKKLINFPISRFIRDVVLRNTLIVLLAITLPFLLRNMLNENFLRLMIVVFVSLIWNASIIYIIGLSKSERKIVTTGILKVLKLK